MALVGHLFERINLPAMIDPAYPVRASIANSDFLKCHLGKNDFEAVEGSSPQRFDTLGTDWSELADQINRAILAPRINGAPIDF